MMGVWLPGRGASRSIKLLGGLPPVGACVVGGVCRGGSGACAGVGTLQARVPAAQGLPRPQGLPAAHSLSGDGVSWCDLADVRRTGRASSVIRRACLQTTGSLSLGRSAGGAGVDYKLRAGQAASGQLPAAYCLDDLCLCRVHAESSNSTGEQLVDQT